MGISQTIVNTLFTNIYTHNLYTIVIIYPIGMEMAPVLIILNKKHLTLPSTQQKNRYILGQIGYYNIIVIILLETRNNNTATIVI